MKKLLLYENTRFWRSTKNILVLLGYVAILVGIIIYNTVLDNNYWRNQKYVYGEEWNAINNIISEVQTEAEMAESLNPDDTATLEEIDKKYLFYRYQYLFNSRQRSMAKFYNLERAQERIELELLRDKHMLKGLETGYGFLSHTPEQVKQRIAFNEYILEQELTPLNSPHEMTATNFLIQLLGYPWILAVLIAIALLSIDIFSGDIEGGAYKILYSQPIHRGRIYAVKYLVRFLYSFTIITGLTVLIFGLLILVNGLGSVNYPIHYFQDSFRSLDTAGDLSFLPWSQYILKAIPLYCFLCLFVMLLIGTASLLLESTGNALNAAFCILVLDFLSRTLFPAESKFYMYWPLTAAEINGVLQGTHTASALAYLTLLSVSVIILFAGGRTILGKQDLTGGIGI